MSKQQSETEDIEKLLDKDEVSEEELVKTNVYKVKVNKEVLEEFFSIPLDKVTKKHIKEVNKVILIILVKYYSKYYWLFQELRSYAYVALCQRHDSFDSNYNAYNYVYTIFRNEIGNRIAFLNKEQSMDDMTEIVHGLTESGEAELPPEIERYKEYLLGMKSFTCIRLPKKDILPLVVFCRLHEPCKKVDVPEFVLSDEKSIKVLYKLLKEIYESE